MEINYTNDAAEALTNLVRFIEDYNTKGAGLRWLNKFEKFLIKHLGNAEIIHFCNNKTFKLLKLKCLYYNDWLIAFSQTKGSITIEAILHKSRITD